MKENPRDKWQKAVLGASERFRRGVEGKQKPLKITQKDLERVAHRLLDQVLKLTKGR